MIYTDYTKIKKVHFKVPELLKDDAEEKVINLFDSIKVLKDDIATLRMEITEREKKLLELEDQWTILSALLDIEFETEEKAEVHQDVNIGFNFHSDINKKIH